MTRIATASLLSLGLSAVGSAQFLHNTTVRSFVQGSDLTQTYDANNSNVNVLENQSYNLGSDTGALITDSNNPWLVTFPNGNVGGAGESGMAQASLVNNALNSVFTGTFSSSTQLSSTISNSGPYYGIYGYSTATASSILYFTPTRPTTMSGLGVFSVIGLGSSWTITLDDISSGQFFNWSGANGSFSTALTFSHNLVSNDNYALYASVNESDRVQFDANTAVNQPGADSGSGYITARFAPTAGAPEPASYALLGLAAVGLLRRRKKI